MQSTQITLRNVPRCPLLSKRIRTLSEHLERYHPHILNCRVAIEQSTAPARKGTLFQVLVRVRVPGREIVASHDHDGDVYVALREAFEVVRRQLGEANALRHAEAQPT